jgi:hypothetical protein
VANDNFAIPYGLDALLARLGLESRSIVHLGAHEGQEVAGYLLAGFDRIMLFEPCPKAFDKLNRRVKACESMVRVARSMNLNRKTPEIRRRPRAQRRGGSYVLRDGLRRGRVDRAHRPTGMEHVVEFQARAGRGTEPEGHAVQTPHDEGEDHHGPIADGR